MLAVLTHRDDTMKSAELNTSIFKPFDILVSHSGSRSEVRIPPPKVSEGNS